MREMGWDYWTYRIQPLWVIEDIVKTMSAEAQAQKEQELKQQRGNSRGNVLSGDAALQYMERMQE